jgi:hypothetical protein
MDNNHEAWVSEELTDIKLAILYRFDEEAGTISQLQNVIVREKFNHCTVQLEVMEFRKEVEDLRRENKDLSDKLYVRQVVGDMLQRVAMQVQHESDLKDIAFDNEKKIIALKLEYEVILADEMSSCERFSKELEAIEATYKQKQIDVKILQEELAAKTSAFDHKISAEVAMVTVAFNNKLAADHRMLPPISTRSSLRK